MRWIEPGRPDLSYTPSRDEWTDVRYHVLDGAPIGPVACRLRHFGQLRHLCRRRLKRLHHYTCVPAFLHGVIKEGGGAPFRVDGNEMTFFAW